ncbi:MAG: hypothetical protein LH471_01645 [Salinibacterium sp.]|nr:hypothetical protein [Salinibacterium sp.]
MPQEFWSNAIFSITPTVLIGLVFWFVLRAIIRADRSERSAYAKVEAEERARRGLDRREADVGGERSGELSGQRSGQAHRELGGKP